MNETESASKHTIIAAWVFGSIILLFYMAVFAFMPASLPDYKHKMLAIVSALLCGLFMFFLVGSLKVTINLSNQWTKLGIQSGGGAAAFVLILWWWNNPNFAPIQSTPSEIVKPIPSPTPEIKPTPSPAKTTQIIRNNTGKAVNAGGNISIHQPTHTPTKPTPRPASIYQQIDGNSGTAINAGGDVVVDKLEK